VLSRGERQRLLRFTTLALGRPVVVLDQPFSTFDPLQLGSTLFDDFAVRSLAEDAAP